MTLNVDSQGKRWLEMNTETGKSEVLSQLDVVVRQLKNSDTSVSPSQIPPRSLPLDILLR